MGLKQDVDAAFSVRDFDGAQRLVVDAYLPVLQSREGVPFSRGSLTVVINRAWEEVVNGKPWIAVDVSASKDGVELSVNNPLLFRHPPVGANGDHDDLMAWSASIILDAIKV